MELETNIYLGKSKFVQNSIIVVYRNGKINARPSVPTLPGKGRELRAIGLYKQPFIKKFLTWLSKTVNCDLPIFNVLCNFNVYLERLIFFVSIQIIRLMICTLNYGFPDTCASHISLRFCNLQSLHSRQTSTPQGKYSFMFLIISHKYM